MTHIDRLIFFTLCLSGVVLPIAVKGFSALFAIAAVLCLISLIQKRPLKYLRQHFLGGNLGWVWVLVAYIFASYFWSATPAFSGALALKLIAFISGFVALLIWMKNTSFTPAQIKYLAASVSIGVGATFISGLWMHYTPYLNMASQYINGQDLSLWLGYTSEPTRQVNRALGIASVLIFICAAFYARSHPKLMVASLIAAISISLLSQSQSAALAMIMGVVVFAFAKATTNPMPRLTHRLMIAGFVGAILFSAPLAKYSFDQPQINNLIPAKLNEVASVNIRRFIFYVYANDTQGHTLFGRGLNSDRNYAPAALPDYLRTAQSIPSMASIPAYFENKNTAIIAQHPHYIFLQFIFNFGIVGGILFLLAVIQALRLLLATAPTSHYPYYLAAVSAYCGQFLFSYSLWQSVMIASSFVIFIIAMMLHKETA
ncbi:MAG: hypothetical protein HAW65_07270 [Alphaproteobacteria bacterium]|nr:hypothetical protein [Alphaproteobacteria bacterium]MBE8221087.1 hypothetical protein [Alphaproteobacteria bacterium]